MTAHDHTTIVPGCYRCELGRDEAASAARDDLRDALKTLHLSADAYIEQLCRALRGVPTHGLGLKAADYRDAHEIAAFALDEQREAPEGGTQGPTGGGA